MGTRYRDKITVEAKSPQFSGVIAGVQFTDINLLELGEPRQPQSFIWRNTTYFVTRILGHWREDAHYWNGRDLHIPQADFFRLLATSTKSANRPANIPTNGSVSPLLSSSTDRFAHNGSAVPSDSSLVSSTDHRAVEQELMCEITCINDEWILQRIWD